MVCVFPLLLETLSNMFPFPCHSHNVSLANATTGSSLHLKHPHSNYKDEKNLLKIARVFEIIFISVHIPRMSQRYELNTRQK